jgi:inner membrane protein
MTLYTHALVGVGLATVVTARRMPLLFWAVVVLLPVLPDLDALFLSDSGPPWEHRGFTHSLSFALAMGLVAAASTYRYFQANFWGMWGLFFTIAASHSVLDALTRGAGGIPFLWPFIPHRYGGWGPVPVADIAFELPNPWVSRAVRSELLWVWLPMGILIGTVVAYRRSRCRATS